jgi:hypothetical protein
MALLTAELLAVQHKLDRGRVQIQQAMDSTRLHGGQHCHRSRGKDNVLG